MVDHVFGPCWDRPVAGIVVARMAGQTCLPAARPVRPLSPAIPCLPLYPHTGGQRAGGGGPGRHTPNFPNFPNFPRFPRFPSFPAVPLSVGSAGPSAVHIYHWYSRDPSPYGSAPARRSGSAEKNFEKFSLNTAPVVLLVT